MAQDLVSNRRCLSDHKKGAEVYWDRYQTRQDDEKLHMEQDENQNQIKQCQKKSAKADSWLTTTLDV